MGCVGAVFVVDLCGDFVLGLLLFDYFVYGLVLLLCLFRLGLVFCLLVRFACCSGCMLVLVLVS